VIFPISTFQVAGIIDVTHHASHNVHTSKNRASKYVRLIQKNTRRSKQIHYYSIEFNTFLWFKDPAGRKISKDTVELNNTIKQLYLIGIYRILCLTTAKSTYFSSSHATLPKTDYFLSHKICLNKFNNRNHTKYALNYNGI
jgi:hypothetical protein